MKPRSRTRRVLKWMGVALCLMLALPYALTAYCLEWTEVNGGRNVRVTAGYIRYAWASGGVRYGRVLYREGQRFRASRIPRRIVLWWPPVQVIGTTPRAVRVMIWVPLVVVAIPTGVLWWLDRRRFPPGRCPKCGYNLTGNVSGICPECGTPIGAAGSPEQD